MKESKIIEKKLIQTGFSNKAIDLSAKSPNVLISNSRETQILLRGMRDKPNVAKITSFRLNIVGDP